MRNPRPRQIALAFPIGNAFIERTLQGVLDYAQERGGWVFTRMPERFDPSVGWLRHWRGDGAFALITTRADARMARALSIPVVNLAGYLAQTGLPTVMVDQEAIGRRAAEHLLARRFQRFGFYGTSGLWYSQRRRAGFQEAVHQAGGDCAVLEVPDLLDARRPWNSQKEELARWLRALHPPVGLLASTDLRAGMVVEACLHAGLRVPEDVAVVGVDNDPVACEFCAVPLSSVSRNDRETGRRAAGLLDQLLEGKKAPAEPVLLPPEGVVARRSTDTLALEDAEVASVVRYMHEHLREPFGVERLAAQTRLSRRRLEQRFQVSLGCSPAQFLNRLRVERARQLLEGPDQLNLTQIAAACGFRELRRFRMVFHRLTGRKPAEHRRRQQGPAPGRGSKKGARAHEPA